MSLESNITSGKEQKEKNGFFYRGARLVGCSFNGEYYEPERILMILEYWDNIMSKAGEEEIDILRRMRTHHLQWFDFVRYKKNKYNCFKARYLNKHKVKRTC